MTEEPKDSSKAANGEDSIYWDKSKGRFVGAVSLGYTSAGKRNRAKVTGKTKTEVRRKLRDLKKGLEAGLKTPANYTVTEAVTDWLAQGLKGKAVSSVATYRSLAGSHITPDLGKAKLRDLSADELDAWLDAKSEVLATQSLKMVHSILCRSLTHAQRRGKVLRNVAELVDVPEGRAGRPSKSLTLRQAEAVLSARRGTWIHAYVVLSLLVGVRTEEARPLTWRHVHTTSPDEASPHVDVWRSVRRHGETKTRKSRRTLAMPRQVATVIDAYRIQQQQECKAAGRDWNEDALVFPNEAGGQRSALNVRRNFRTLLKHASIPNPHEWTTRECRTSCVSLLSDYGIPIEVIARVVGHSDTQTTERVYRKQLRPFITQGAEAMDEIFGDEESAAPAESPQEP